MVSVTRNSLSISSLFGLVKFSATLGLKLVDLSHKLLLFKSDTFLFNFQVLKALPVVPGCLIELLFSSLQLCSLKLKLLIDLEQSAEITIQALDLKDGLTMMLCQFCVHLFEFLYSHSLIPVPLLQSSYLGSQMLLASLEGALKSFGLSLVLHVLISELHKLTPKGVKL